MKNTCYELRFNGKTIELVSGKNCTYPAECDPANLSAVGECGEKILSVNATQDTALKTALEDYAEILGVSKEVLAEEKIITSLKEAINMVEPFSVSVFLLDEGKEVQLAAIRSYRDAECVLGFFVATDEVKSEDTTKPVELSTEKMEEIIKFLRMSDVELLPTRNYSEKNIQTLLKRLDSEEEKCL